MFVRVLPLDVPAWALRLNGPFTGMTVIDVYITY